MYQATTPVLGRGESLECWFLLKECIHWLDLTTTWNDYQNVFLLIAAEQSDEPSCLAGRQFRFSVSCDGREQHLFYTTSAKQQQGWVSIHCRWRTVERTRRRWGGHRNEDISPLLWKISTGSSSGGGWQSIGWSPPVSVCLLCAWIYDGMQHTWWWLPTCWWVPVGAQSQLFEGLCWFEQTSKIYIG